MDRGYDNEMKYKAGLIRRKNKYIMCKLEEIWNRIWENKSFEYSENIIIKTDKYLIGRNTIFSGSGGIIIEEDVQIGYGAVILSKSTIDDVEDQVILRKNCKIGSNAVIMPNVTIGENSIVGAGAVVTKGTKIPANELWLGVPAKKK